MPLLLEFITAPVISEIEQITQLYRMADWWDVHDDANQDLVKRIVSGSHCFLVAREGKTIVGMGRAISDGVNDAYIQDVTVHPDYRHQDIGTQVVLNLVARLQQDGMRWIGLIAGSNSHPFYKKLGFEEMPFSTPMLLKQAEVL